ncbi:MAG: IS630 family transposase [Holosporaceae bacterium]|jgi:transposase|nr:IS630 family transposase [Holosporaceae bacterium]
MKKNFLSKEEYEELRSRHRTEKDGRTRDRIKAVLLSHRGWTYKKISEALFWEEETISKQVEEFINERKLSIKTGGSVGKLSEEQKNELLEHLEKHTYAKSAEICEYVKKKYGVVYAHRGMANWLRFHGFSHKKSKTNPKNVDTVAQKRFVNAYKEFVKNTPEDEPILFMDAVHSTMNTKVSCGWIRTGVEKLIKTSGSRTRLNIIGAINLKSMEVKVMRFQTVNSDSIIEFFDFLKEKYPGKIHIILDQSGYHTSEKTLKAAKERDIVLHFLPPYSPNLNPIERLWKVMNEYVRNNRYFKTVREFKHDIMAFFWNTWNYIAEKMRSRINDNFYILKKSNFSA